VEAVLAVLEVVLAAQVVLVVVPAQAEPVPVNSGKDNNKTKDKQWI